MTEYEQDKLVNKDYVATPGWVVSDIYKLIGIEDYKNIWLPFDNFDSEFKLKADLLKLNYKASHIFDDSKSDFFKTKPPKECDLMISNSPFSKQYEIIKRSFELIESKEIKAFALLLPLSTLETTSRANLYEKYKDKLSIIIYKKRIKFKGKKTSFNTACCWVCYNIEKLPTLSWI